MYRVVARNIFVVLLVAAIGVVTTVAVAQRQQVTHVVPFIAAASGTQPQGFLRIVNNSDEAGSAIIIAIDDADSASDELTLAPGANETVGFDAESLETGAPDAGLTGSAGRGKGDWRLRLLSELDIEILAFARTSDGALWETHEMAPLAAGGCRIATFNPGSNVNQASWLRLVNPADEPAAVTIRGTDDSGAAPSPGLRLEVPSGEAESFTADELESGVAPGLEAWLGDGLGKWRLDIESSVPIRVMSLLSNPTGHLTNLSTIPAQVTGGVHRVPLFPSTSDPYGRQGCARAVNRSDVVGEVLVKAFDDLAWTYDALTLSIGLRQTADFNSEDLEFGNAGKGLTGSTGTGEGDRRLELSSELDIEVLSYVRTVGGLDCVTPMHDTAAQEAGGLVRYYVPVFNPAGYEGHESRLHLVNFAASDAQVGISGLDDAGRLPPEGDVSLILIGVSFFVAFLVDNSQSSITNRNFEASHDLTCCFPG